MQREMSEKEGAQNASCVSSGSEFAAWLRREPARLRPRLSDRDQSVLGRSRAELSARFQITSPL